MIAVRGRICEGRAEVLCAPVAPGGTMPAMPYASLADFLEALDACGQLARVDVEVDGHLELAEITRRVAAAGGPALLFERVAGRQAAVVANLLGTEDRLRRALGLESLADLLARTESLVQTHTPQNWFERLRVGAGESGAAKFKPKLVKSGACQQVVRLGRDVELADFAFVKHWPAESAATVTAGRVIASRGAERPQISALCPLAVIDSQHLGILADGGSLPAQLWAACRTSGEKVPLAVALGGDPAALVATSLELPRDVETDHITGLLRCQPLELVKCRTHDLLVPADADVVIEGYLDPEASSVEIAVAGPGGSHLRVETQAPVVHVTAVTHRAHPIVPVIVDSGTVGEAAALAMARERLLLAAAQTVAPSIVALRLPAFGGLDRFAFVSIRKTAPHQAREVAAALWSMGPVRTAKFLVVVDEHVDVYNTSQVLAEIGAHAVPARDLFSYDGPPCPWGEGAGDDGGPTRHVAIDATTKTAGETPQVTAQRLAPAAETTSRVNDRWSEYHIGLAELAGAAFGGQ